MSLYRYGYWGNNGIADSVALYTLVAVQGDPLMRHSFISADIGAQIQHGDRSITHLRRRSIGLLLKRAIKAVELEHRDSVRLAKVGILLFRKLFVILAPCVCCQCVGKEVIISSGVLPLILYNYARVLDLQGRYKDGKKYAQEGHEACIKYGNYQLLHGCLAIDAECTHFLGDDKESAELYCQAYYICKAIGYTNDLITIKKEAKDYLGLTFQY